MYIQCNITEYVYSFPMNQIYITHKNKDMFALKKLKRLFSLMQQLAI